ncbi:F-box family protein [Thalictrum thalictroides]|uniref:F-box family protein n=1 Tax=Thalictrum thalictroides TaxID=46969 RepID=A0A7J6V5I0_THATH|nr:F-box family protein [Thalictrum thalictroides]
MPYTEVLKAVFPFLDGKDLVTCMLVCKHWRDIARDDYFWKCICAKRWPSICKKPSTTSLTYQKLFLTFYKRQRKRTLLPPRLSFDDLEFYIDIWGEEAVIFSEVIPGPVLRTGIKIHPPGTCDILRFHLEKPDYKLTVLVEPRFTVRSSQTVSVSLFVGRKDTNKIARIVNKSLFDYIDRTSYRALAYDYLDFSPEHPFVSGIRAWISLLFLDAGNDGAINVFGIAIDFCDVANSEDEVLRLLDMLDWK